MNYLKYYPIFLGNKGNCLAAITKKERFVELVSKPDELLETICCHVASGGSLIELCKMWEVNFGSLNYWLISDKDRASLYYQSQEARSEWFRESILLTLKRLSNSDIRQLFDKNDKMLPSSEWPEDIAYCISSMDVQIDKDGDTINKVKMWNKEKGLELLGKNLSMFIDRIDHSGKISLEDLITASREEDNVGK